MFQPASNQRGSNRVHIIQVGRGNLRVQEDKEGRGRFLRAGLERSCSDMSLRNNLLFKEPVGLRRRYSWKRGLAGPLWLDPGLQERAHSAHLPGAAPLVKSENTASLLPFIELRCERFIPTPDVCLHENHFWFSVASFWCWPGSYCNITHLLQHTGKRARVCFR